jgi:hypothetical protein
MRVPCSLAVASALIAAQPARAQEVAQLPLESEFEALVADADARAWTLSTDSAHATVGHATPAFRSTRFTKDWRCGSPIGAAGDCCA